MVSFTMFLCCLYPFQSHRQGLVSHFWLIVPVQESDLLFQPDLKETLKVVEYKFPCFLLFFLHVEIDTQDG